MSTPEGVLMDAPRHHHHERRSQPITIGAPAVATGFTYTAPGSQITRVATLSFVLFTDANAANRLPRIDFNNAAGDAFFIVAAPFTTPANSTGRYSFGIGVMQFGANGAVAIGGPLPDIELCGGLSISVAIGAVQAGDQVDGISLFVDQWPVRD